MFREQSKTGSKNKENSEDSNHSGEHNSTSSPITLDKAQRLPDPYSYSHLLDRVYDRLYTEMPQLQTRQRGHMPAFLVTRQRRTILWTNFLQVCTAMGRNPQHVMSFVTTGTVRHLRVMRLCTTCRASDRLHLRGCPCVQSWRLTGRWTRSAG